jgi:hypothetical protein
MSVGVVFSVFIPLGVCSTPWICEMMPLTKLESFLVLFLVFGFLGGDQYIWFYICFFKINITKQAISHIKLAITLKNLLWKTYNQKKK